MVNSKKKGNAWENEIAKLIRAKFIPTEIDDKTAHNLVHRTPMSGGHVERGDLIIKPPVWKWFPWFIECRNRESWSWKNIMEQGKDSIIVKWFLEDAEDKCHPYDNNGKYTRYPLLLFTKKYQKIYFGALSDDLDLLLGIRFVDIPTTFNPCLLVEIPSGYEKTLVLGQFDQFLGLYADTPQGIRDDIADYLGVNNGGA